MFNIKFNYLSIKYIFDKLFALIFLIISFPLFLIISILISSTSPGPIFYKHKRLGKLGRSIYCYKFRTMYPNSQISLDQILKTDKRLKNEFYKNFKLKKDPRVTKVGIFLRKTSLDELPQLVNVLKGEMSLIGPRPITSLEKDKYGIHIKKLLSVKPGISGLWQVCGRSRVSYQERVKMDIDYISKVSFLLDFKIIIKTIIIVLFINPEESY